MVLMTAGMLLWLSCVALAQPRRFFNGPEEELGIHGAAPPVFGREAALSEGASSSARLSLVGLRRSFARGNDKNSSSMFDAPNQGAPVSSLSG
jgi:hypothetical protein